jgi:hypothetical protein
MAMTRLTAGPSARAWPNSISSVRRSRCLKGSSAKSATRGPLATAAKRSMAMVLLVTALASAVESRPPNLIIIFADDLGYQDLGCFGVDNDQNAAR